MEKFYKSISEFANVDFGRVRCFVDDDHEIWFIVKDIKRALQIQGSKNIKELTSNWVYFDLFTENGHGNFICINEAGIYDLIWKSTAPGVAGFKEWVFEEVLPSIRKEGQFLTEERYDEKVEVFNKYMSGAELTPTDILGEGISPEIILERSTLSDDPRYQYMLAMISGENDENLEFDFASCDDFMQRVLIVDNVKFKYLDIIINYYNNINDSDSLNRLAVRLDEMEDQSAIPEDILLEIIFPEIIQIFRL